jgi:glycosyltransferase involved in cell wall biosynthesis
MAYYQVGKDVRRAVDSILNQTHRNVQLVLINDADFDDPPWPYVEDIVDPRLIRYELSENRGRYFVDQVIFEATQPSWWALQDPDDQAELDRFEIMLEHSSSGMAIAPRIEYWPHKVRSTASMSAFKYPTLKASGIRHIEGYGAGIISGERIHVAGGFHADMRVGYDTYLMNACWVQGNVGRYDRPLQHKFRLNPNSLTQSPKTGTGTKYRRRARMQLDMLWREAYKRHRAGQEMASVVHGDVSESTWGAVAYHASQLHALLAS